ncbi:MAG TPA: tetratricopeptide repeat protein [Candidatus Angelobacter sp.]
MKPYKGNFPFGWTALFLPLFVSILGLTSAFSADGAKNSSFDSYTKNGFEHYYSLEYDKAMADFQKAVEASPDDPRGYNHLLEAVLFRELYKHDALDTSLYTQEGFLNSRQIVLDSAVKQQIKDLVDKAMALSEKRLKSNSQDVQALYARGVTRGLRSTYLGLVEKAWFSALRNALGSRSDHEAVLTLKPDFVDAKTVVGIHNYIVAVLPLRTKILASIIGVTGDKKKGLEYLAEAGKAGGESSVDARVALALFLRREQRNPEALKIVQTLVQEHPRNFLFALEQANLMKDGGKGPVALAAYRTLLDSCKSGKYPDPHVELAQFGLGEALRGQNQYPEAILAYEAAGNASSDNHELRQRALLAAGEVADLMAKREEALKEYQAAIALDSSTNEAETARKYLDKPYKGR